MAPPAAEVQEYTTGGLMAHWKKTVEEVSSSLPPPQPDADSLPTSGPQGSVVPYTILEDPQSWKAADYPEPGAYTYCLDEQDVRELDAAIAAVEASGVPFETVRAETFPLPTLGPKLAAISKEVITGKGFQIIRGVPVKRYTMAQSMLAWYGMGMHFGTVQVQNTNAHLIGHIMDHQWHKKQYFHPRGGDTSFDLNPHTDSTTGIVGLMCLTRAKQGGECRWASLASVYNEMLRRGRKDLVEELLKPQWYLPKGGFNQGDKPFYGPDGAVNYDRLSLLSFGKGYLTAYYSGPYLLYSQRDPGSPKYTEKQLEAMNMFDALAASPEVYLEYLLQPGDIQLLNNPIIMHARTSFQDGEAIDEKRHLLRMWVKTPWDIPYSPRHDNAVSGADPKSGGWEVRKGLTPSIPLTPCPNS